MRQVNMHEAKTQLSRLIDAVAEGREDGNHHREGRHAACTDCST